MRSREPGARSERSARWHWWLIVLFFSLPVDRASFAAAFSFDDIDFWVGEGANRAALVIDWVDDSTAEPALAWGYRWDGSAKGRDMLKAVVAADDRLFAKLGGTLANPVAAYGLGYDANDDGAFGLDDSTIFDEEGFAFTAPADGAASLDSSDHYGEGWFLGFWHYGIAATNPYDGGTWADTSLGMAGRTLVDGAWDSWVFTPSFDFSAFAENPVAAPTPGGLLWGDYNQNDAVDAADYGVWRDTLAAAGNSLPNDPTPGTVDESDFEYWRDHFGESLGGGAGSSIHLAPGDSPGADYAVPEPATWQMMTFAVLTCWTTLFRRRKEND